MRSLLGVALCLLTLNAQAADVSQLSSQDILARGIALQQEMRAYLASVGHRIVKEQTLEGSGSSAGFLSYGSFQISGQTLAMAAGPEIYQLDSYMLDQNAIDYFSPIITDLRSAMTQYEDYQITKGVTWFLELTENALAFNKAYDTEMGPDIRELRELLYELQRRGAQGLLSQNEKEAWGMLQAWASGTYVKAPTILTSSKLEISYERYGFANAMGPMLFLIAGERMFVRGDDSDPGQHYVSTTQSWARQIGEMQLTIY